MSSKISLNSGESVHLAYVASPILIQPVFNVALVLLDVVAIVMTGTHEFLEFDHPLARLLQGNRLI